MCVCLCVCLIVCAHIAEIKMIDYRAADCEEVMTKLKTLIE